MKRLLLLPLGLGIAIWANAQAAFQPLIDLKPDKTVFLYADARQEALKTVCDPVIAADVECLGLDVKEECGISEPETMEGDLGQIRSINRSSRFDIYFPDKPNGQMVVICPGGGYRVVCTWGEGLYVAQWLLGRGITVAVAKHRMPNGHWSVPLDDMQEIFRYCRSHAAAWGVSQIGVMGFSAGGHLAASVSTLYTDAATRPDFSILFYPVITFTGEYVEGGTRGNLLGRDNYWAGRRSYSADEYIARQQQYASLKEHYSLQNRVDANTPPAFIVHGEADNVVPVQNAILYYTSLVKSGVQSELHIFDSPKHGFCFFPEGTPDWIEPQIRSSINNSLERWLQQIK